MHVGDEWLGLTDYASKYRISVSTLRRRIKNGQITHRLDDGKYLVPNSPPEQMGLGAQSNPEPIMPEKIHPQAVPISREAEEKLNQLRSSAGSISMEAGQGADQNNEAVLSSASRLLTELKRAYMNILQEKEEQLIQLKEEVSGLKTLVRVLEDDNDRLRRLTGNSPPS